MSNFWARTITGLSMVFLLLAALWINPWLFAGMFFIITLLGLWEFYGIAESAANQPQKIYGTIAGGLIYTGIVCLHLIPDLHSWVIHCFYILPLFLLFLPFVFEIYRKRPYPLNNIALTVFGVLYIALPMALINLINGMNVIRFLGFPALLLAYFILTWFYDTGAYLYGKQFGKHKFFERISPGKTWEGTMAGVIVAIATAIVFSFLVSDIHLVDWIVLTLLVIFFGTYGDLAESLFKRSLNLKDSGNILPGHGGILDRFDTLFLSAPFVFLYFFLRNLL